MNILNVLQDLQWFCEKNISVVQKTKIHKVQNEKPRCVLFRSNENK
jgi:hypothetical protein